ncbi:hypothetical protein HDU77_009875 [Chytriomyces hyalinus]|nr:hypothetical protein HDU77_009875 [Chytriomyces hyalinus]
MPPPPPPSPSPSTQSSAVSLVPQSPLSQPVSRQSLQTPAARTNKQRIKKPSQREKKELSRRTSHLDSFPSSSSSANYVSKNDPDYMLALQLDASNTSEFASYSPQVNKRGEISLNHLINFSFPVREVPAIATTVRRKKSSLLPTFNKEKFINANYRFVLKPAPYTVHLKNPDSPLPWHQILEIVIPYPVHKHPTCPICLSPPVAPRSTRCGHVFCSPCLLRYLDSGPKGGDYGTCPVCLEYVYSKDARCVTFHGVEEWSSGYNGHMVLMKRSLTSTIALPNSSFVHSTNAPPYWISEHKSFAHLLLGTKEEHISRLRKDYNELGQVLLDLFQEEKAFRAAGSSGSQLHTDLAIQTAAERKYVEAARVIIKSGMDDVDNRSWEIDYEADSVNLVPGYTPAKNGGRKSSPTKAGGRAMSRDKREAEVKPSDASAVSDTVVASSIRGRSSSPKRPNARDESNSKQINSRTGQPSAEFYYFYQAHDGQHMYLHPLDIKILKQEFKEYSNFPDAIFGRVLSVQESTMNEDLRKRCRYMSHLPLSCDVNFCEMELSAVVSADTLAIFEKELSHRREAHSKKESVKKGKGTVTDGCADMDMSVTSSPEIDWTNHRTPPTHESSSSWEDPSMFDVLFPAATPSSTLSDIKFDHPSTHARNSGGLSFQQRPSSTTSFANAAAMARPSKGLTQQPRYGSRFATLKSDGASDEEGREYRYVEEAWAVDLQLEDQFLGQEDGIGILNASKGKKSKKKKSVVLVSNGGRRGDL